jgi:dTDP-4-dehydrorhamnose 3,5-epimerase
MHSRNRLHRTAESGRRRSICGLWLDAVVDIRVGSPTCGAPGRGHGINPLDPKVGIDWPTRSRSGQHLELILSEKDTAAPSLAEADALGLLPRHTDAREWINGFD